MAEIAAQWPQPLLPFPVNTFFSSGYAQLCTARDRLPRQQMNTIRRWRDSEVPLLLTPPYAVYCNIVRHALGHAWWRK
jgi:hypothetical protein